MPRINCLGTIISTAVFLLCALAGAQEGGPSASGVAQRSGFVSPAMIQQLKADDLPTETYEPEEVPLGDGEYSPPRDFPFPDVVIPDEQIDGDMLGSEKNVSVKAVPALGTNFEGIHFNQSLNIPPDTYIATGPDHVIEVVNRDFRIFSKSGTTLFSATLAHWFSNVNTLGLPFDPKVVYDPHAGRWIILALSRGETTGSSYLISVSRDSNPFNSWLNSNLDGSVDGSNATTNWADFPGLGYDSSEAVYLTSNQFAFAGGFQYSKLRILYKSQLYWVSGGVPLGWWDFWDWNNLDGTTVFGWKPAQVATSLAGNFLLNTAHTGSNFVSMWRVSFPLSTPPLFSLQKSINIGTYAAPPLARQPNNGALIHVTDCRVQEVHYIDGKLTTAFTIGSTWGGATLVDAIRLLVIAPFTDSAELNVNYGSAFADYYYPQLIRTQAGDFGLVFNRSSPDLFIDARYTTKFADEVAFPPSVTLKAGEAVYERFDLIGRNRWGDYSGIAIDPSDPNVIWMGAEYADSANTWGTWIGRVALAGTTPSERSITISQPNGGELWFKRTRREIAWTSLGNVGTNVSVTARLGTTATTIIASTPNDGSLLWNVPLNIAMDTNYLIEIASVDFPTILDQSDGLFSIQPLPIVTDVSALNVPEGGVANFQVKLAAQPTNNVTVNMSRNSGDSDLTVSSGASRVFTPANWNTFQMVGLAAAEDADFTIGIATIRCSGSGLANAIVTATEVDNDNSATITLTRPNGGETFYKRTRQTISWNSMGSLGANVSITAWRGAASTVVSASTPNDGSFLWCLPSNIATGNDYTIEVCSVSNPSICDESNAVFSVRPLRLTTNVNAVSVPEGGGALFQVKLQNKPCSNVTVSVARNSGDTNISVSSGASLVFTPANWNVYQTVRLSAAQDADSTNGIAKIRCSGPGLMAKTVTATEADND